MCCQYRHHRRCIVLQVIGVSGDKPADNAAFASAAVCLPSQGACVAIVVTASATARVPSSLLETQAYLPAAERRGRSP